MQADPVDVSVSPNGLVTPVASANGDSPGALAESQAGGGACSPAPTPSPASPRLASHRFLPCTPNGPPPPAPAGGSQGQPPVQRNILQRLRAQAFPSQELDGISIGIEASGLLGHPVAPNDACLAGPLPALSPTDAGSSVVNPRPGPVLPARSDVGLRTRSDGIPTVPLYPITPSARQGASSTSRPAPVPMLVENVGHSQQSSFASSMPP